jgi:shikimate dehydrogenase
MLLPDPATQRTLYFIGVTTAKSSIMQVYPRWAAEALDLKDTVIKGIDIEIHAPVEHYRQVVDFIKNDPLSIGALVTTHKIDLYQACKDQFDGFDEYARLFGELSSISKEDGRLIGKAKDPITSGLSLAAFVPTDYFAKQGGALFIMGAGGSAIAICSQLLHPANGRNIPSQTVVSNRSLPRLLEIERLVRLINPQANASFHLAPTMADNDALLAALPPNSLVINATGLGKDRPGSPLSDAGQFPTDSLVWELNYRGELDFMQQALKQKEEQRLHVEDGWTYFIYGWTEVIAEVFHLEIKGERFAACDRIARSMRK